eukprot:8497043-Alexandrium_andersonii.AAC.1
MLGTRVLRTRVLRAEHERAEYARFGLRAEDQSADRVPRTLPNAPLRAGCVPGFACCARAFSETR